MSVFQTYVAATSTASAINSLRSARALDRVLELERAAEARQRDVEGMRQTLFEVAQLIAAAAERSADADALYLALRARPVLHGEIDEHTLPTLQDKAFLANARAARDALEQRARSRLAPETQTWLERIITLEDAVPLLRGLAAWIDIRAHMRRWTPAWVWAGRRRDIYGRIYLGVPFGGALLITIAGWMSSTLQTLLGLPWLAFMLWGFVAGAVRASSTGALVRRGAEGGVHLEPLATTVAEVNQLVHRGMAALPSLGLPALPQDSSALLAEAGRLDGELLGLRGLVFPVVHTSAPLPAQVSRG